MVYVHYLDVLGHYVEEIMRNNDPLKPPHYMIQCVVNMMEAKYDVNIAMIENIMKGGLRSACQNAT